MDDIEIRFSNQRLFQVWPNSFRFGFPLADAQFLHTVWGKPVQRDLRNPGAIKQTTGQQNILTSQ